MAGTDFLSSLLPSITGGGTGAAGLTNADGSVNVGGIISAGQGLFAGLNGAKPTQPVTTAPQITNPTFNLSIPTFTPEAQMETTSTTNGTVSFSTGDTAKSNTMLYVGIGAGVLVLIVVLFFVFKKK
jgi:LPXTG-motif cell wall-anchored protein